MSSPQSQPVLPSLLHIQQQQQQQENSELSPHIRIPEEDGVIPHNLKGPLGNLKDWDSPKHAYQ